MTAVEKAIAKTAAVRVMMVSRRVMINMFAPVADLSMTDARKDGTVRLNAV